MMKLRINPLVADDLLEIKEFIAEDNLEKAIEIVKIIYDKFDNILKFPSLGTDLSKKVSFKTDYKFVSWEDYIIIYKINGDYVEIYRIINRYRDITRIFDEDGNQSK